ncbi:sulfite reductase flavoprotein subunit alpha [Citricoccus nitrophenolicus]
MTIDAARTGKDQTVEKTATRVAELTILFGSETGNAEFLAHQIQGDATNSGVETDIASLDEWLHGKEKAMSRLLLVTSTYDNGHMPSNASEFWDWLQRLEPGAFDGLPYAALAIGDSMYEDFCKATHDLDGRLEELGAVRVVDSVDCDVDFDFTAGDWYPGALEALRSSAPWARQVVETEVEPEPVSDEEKPADVLHSTRIAAARRLSGESSGKCVMHYELEFPDAPFEYQPGDSIAVFPRNSDALVDEWLAAFGADGRTMVTVGNRELPLADALREELELNLAHPGLLLALARLRPENELAQEGVRVIQTGDRETLDSWLWDRDVLDVLRDLDCLVLPIELVLAELRPMQHRAYSIASSPLSDGDTVHITVSAVEYDAHERTHHGAASRFLERAAETGETFTTKILPAHEFRLPADEVPVIMIGPGVGVAPFRSFLRHREASTCTGRNWLFFGDQHRAHDYLYEDEFEAQADSGLLTQVSLAFSRDQEDKHYVQHDMLTRADEIRAWLDEGAHVFVCGDKTRMARDVDNALLEILADGQSTIIAGTKLAQLKASGRYVKDVY